MCIFYVIIHFSMDCQNDILHLIMPVWYMLQYTLVTIGTAHLYDASLLRHLLS